MTSPDKPQEAAALLRRLLEAVDRGDLDATGPAAGLVRQIQGAAEALELLTPTTNEGDDGGD